MAQGTVNAKITAPVLLLPCANFAGVGLSAALVSIPVDHTITAGYVYGLNTVTDYCGAFMGGSSNLLLDVAGGAVACNGVYAEIIGGHNYVPSLGLSITNYTTTQTNEHRGRFETTEKVVFLSHYSHVVTVKLYELE